MLRRLASTKLVRQIEAITTRHNLTTVSSAFPLHLSGINNDRYLSTNTQPLRTAALSSKSELVTPLDAAGELEEFMSVFPDLIRDVAAAVNRYDLTKDADASSWLTKAMLYNVPKGKRNRGLLTVSTFKILQSENSERRSKYFENRNHNKYFVFFTELLQDLRKAHYLGWCVEMTQALFLVLDDIMDHSLTRRGSACWYKVPDVGLTAINDSIMMENSIYQLLKQHLSDCPNYTQIVELFHEAVLVTSIGESLDMQTAEKQLEAFTLEQYTQIVHNKTSFYSFYLPVASAMFLAGHKNANHFSVVKEILYEIGFFFQVQDDYLDCFGDPAVTGKIGTDIQDKKCSWFAVQCLSMATPEQREVMNQCYGTHNEADVQRVKALYDELGLRKLYSEYEQRSYDEIEKRIKQLPTDFPKSIFYQIMATIYRRKH